MKNCACIGRSSYEGFAGPTVRHPELVSGSRKIAFTLAEVLITLGIIGVVAALTMPVLIAQHRKQVVETKLAKFYSTVNQALKMAEAEYGEPSGWDNMGSTCELKDEEAETLECVEGSSTALRWFNKYLGKYMQTVKIATDTPKAGGTAVSVIAYLPDGSLMAATEHGWNYYISEKYYNDFKENPDQREFGTYRFAFWYDQKHGMLTSRPDYDDCNPNGRGVSCLQLIMQNAWKIPKDYPLKF